MLHKRQFWGALFFNKPLGGPHRYPLAHAVCLLSILLFSLFQPNAFAKKAPEYQIKATFLFHFLDFTKWPNSKSADKTICIFGLNPFDNHLQVLVDINRNDQAVVVKHTATLNDTHDCHILFISRSEENNLSQILANLENKPLLTVSDIDSFAMNSGMIELAIKSNKTKLIINLNTVRSAGIRLDSNLIDLAQVIGGQLKGKLNK